MSTVRVIVDDAQLPASGYEGTQWVHETDQVEALGGTLSICHAGSTTTGFSVPPSLLLVFAGQPVLCYLQALSPLIVLLYIN